MVFGFCVLSPVELPESLLGVVWRNQRKNRFSACAAIEVQEREDDRRLFFVSAFKSFDTNF
jgi:hypothetical protein